MKIEQESRIKKTELIVKLSNSKIEEHKFIEKPQIDITLTEDEIKSLSQEAEAKLPTLTLTSDLAEEYQKLFIGQEHNFFNDLKILEKDERMFKSSEYLMYSNVVEDIMQFSKNAFNNTLVKSAQYFFYDHIVFPEIFKPKPKSVALNKSVDLKSIITQFNCKSEEEETVDLGLTKIRIELSQNEKLFRLRAISVASKVHSNFVRHTTRKSISVDSYLTFLNKHYWLLITVWEGYHIEWTEEHKAIFKAKKTEFYLEVKRVETELGIQFDPREKHGFLTLMVIGKWAPKKYPSAPSLNLSKLT